MSTNDTLQLSSLCCTNKPLLVSFQIWKTGEEEDEETDENHVLNETLLNQRYFIYKAHEKKTNSFF